MQYPPTPTPKIHFNIIPTTPMSAERSPPSRLLKENLTHISPVSMSATCLPISSVLNLVVTNGEDFVKNYRDLKNAVFYCMTQLHLS
jgi:hypothetical protein